MKQVKKQPMKTLLIDMLPVKMLLSEEAGGKFVARGEFMRCDVRTENGRIYKSNIIAREIARLQEDIKARRLFGELDHPEDGKTRLSRVSHLITDLHMEGNAVIGAAEILNTDAGLNLKAIIEAGGQVGVSSRGMGSVNEDGIVNDDYQLITFDFVAQPAIRNAYPTFMSEEVNMNLKELKEKNPDLVEQLKEELKNEMKDELEKELRSEIELEIEKEKETEEQEKKEVEKEIEKAKEQMKEEFKSIVEEMREKIRREVEEEMASRHGIESVVLARLKESILPLISDDDIIKENRDLKEKLLQMTEITKKLGNELFLEKALSKEKYADFIRKGIGDVNKYESIDEIKKRIDELRSLAESGIGDVEREFKSEVERLKEMVEKLIKENEEMRKEKEIAVKEKETSEKEKEELRETVNKLVSENNEMKKSVKELLDTLNKTAMEAIVWKKIRDNPTASKLLKLVEEGKITSPEQLDVLLEERRRPSDDVERIRRYVKGESWKEPEKVEGDKESHGVLEEELSSIGIRNVDEIFNLIDIDKRLRNKKL